MLAISGPDAPRLLSELVTCPGCGWRTAVRQYWIGELGESLPRILWWCPTGDRIAHVTWPGGTARVTWSVLTPAAEELEDDAAIIAPVTSATERAWWPDDWE